MMTMKPYFSPGGVRSSDLVVSGSDPSPRIAGRDSGVSSGSSSARDQALELGGIEARRGGRAATRRRRFGRLAPGLLCRGRDRRQSPRETSADKYPAVETQR
jgi:hypothetical protein